MPVQLFPLTLKGGGILRDGSKYQNEFCTEGNWVRFYQGKPQKMGGQQAILKKNNEDEGAPKNVNCLISIWIMEKLFYIVVNDDNIYSNYTSISQPKQFQSVWRPNLDDGALLTEANLLWQAIPVNVVNLDENRNPAPGPTRTNIVLIGNYNKKDINNNTSPLLYRVIFNNGGIATVTPFDIYPRAVNNNTDLPNLNGGGCYVDNLLFLYGSCGTVAWSRAEDPFNFDGGTSGRINVSTDKVIYGTGVRGGSNPPTLLFWTLNSVVRVSNQSAESSIIATPIFQTDVITSESSILSSRSVVEYDGMFFWLGIDRIFLYNGVVREVLNNTNFNWFFSELDTDRRQLVFGLKNAEKGEIWWYFPTRDGKKENIAGCDHALIYNIRENSWYDTPIRRDCGMFDGSSGKMITYGQVLVQPDKENPIHNNFVWMHEEGVKQALDDAEVGIPSSFTTPTFSLTCFNPLGEAAGIDNLISLERIEPDFGLKKGAAMDMVINTKYYADSDPEPSPTITLVGGEGKKDLRHQGRNISLTFSSEADFQLGTTLLAIKQGDGR